MFVFRADQSAPRDVPQQSAHRVLTYFKAGASRVIGKSGTQKSI